MKWVASLPLLALVGLPLALAAFPRMPAAAITNDEDVTFTVVQSPFPPAVLPVGTEVRFDVTAVSARDFASLSFEFDYPEGLSFLSGESDPPGIACADDTPQPGVVRCDYGAVVAGPLVPLSLVFAVADGATALTAPSQVRMRAGVGDGQPDTAASGDDRFLGAGSIHAADAFQLRVEHSVTSAFEGSVVATRVELTNLSDTSPLGTFDLVVRPAPGLAWWGDCASTSESAPGTFSSDGAVAACAGVDLAPGGQLTMTVVLSPSDTADGDDLTIDLVALALGVASDTLTEAPVEVLEVGLVRTSPPPVVNLPVVVCTDDVTVDVASLAARGARQPGDVSRLRGAVSGAALLQARDFSVTGPQLPALQPADGCATGQSGVTFVPEAPGTYIVSAHFNSGGTNSLVLSVADMPATPTPTATPSPSPTASPTATPTPSPTASPTPRPSSEIALLAPLPSLEVVARSRLTFSVATGNIDASEVALVARNLRDGSYWNAETNIWQQEPVANPMARTGTRWELPVVGAARRQFAGVELEVQVVVSGPAGGFTMPSPVTVRIR